VPVGARLRHLARGLLPELADGALLADHHPRAPAHRRGGEGAAAVSGGDDVGADVAERRELPALLERGEPSEPSPRHVLEEDALHRIRLAEGEDLLELRLHRSHATIVQHRGRSS
jgi:hypothetical protein